MRSDGNCASGNGYDHHRAPDIPRAVLTGIRPAHKAVEKPTGLDWSKHTPTCLGCGTQTGGLNKLDLCTTCDPPVAAASPSAPVPSQADSQGEPTKQASAPRAASASSAVGEPLLARFETLLLDINATMKRHALDFANLEAELRRLRQDLASMEPADIPRRAPSPAPRRRRSGMSGKAVDEHAIVAEYLDGDTAPVIATRHGILANRVRAILDRHGVERRDDRASRSGGANRFVADPELVADVRRRYVEAGESTTAIGKTLGVDRRVISRILTDAGVSLRPPAHLGGGAALTSADEAAIVQSYRDGDGLAVLARRYRTRQERIRDILTGAGIEIRPKGAGRAIADRLLDLGVSAHDVKVWAVEQGLLDRVAAGLVARTVVDAYTAAHPESIEEPA